MKRTVIVKSDGVCHVANGTHRHVIVDLDALISGGMEIIESYHMTSGILLVLSDDPDSRPQQYARSAAEACV